jgi:hypothetical protein
MLISVAIIVEVDLTCVGRVVLGVDVVPKLAIWVFVLHGKAVRPNGTIGDVESFSGQDQVIEELGSLRREV